MRIRFDFGSVTLDAETLDTPTARAIMAALPLEGSALTWGEEVYFDIAVKVARDRLLAGRSCDRHRLRPHADLEGRRDAARQPLQHLGEGAGRREDAGEGQGGRQDQDHGVGLDGGGRSSVRRCAKVRVKSQALRILISSSRTS